MPPMDDVDGWKKRDADPVRVPRLFHAAVERAHQQGRRDFDLISMLAHSPATRNMAPREFLGNLILLIVGGNDTTRNSITGGCGS